MKFMQEDQIMNILLLKKAISKASLVTCSNFSQSPPALSWNNLTAFHFTPKEEALIFSKLCLYCWVNMDCRKRQNHESAHMMYAQQGTRGTSRPKSNSEMLWLRSTQDQGCLLGPRA